MIHRPSCCSHYFWPAFFFFEQFSWAVFKFTLFWVLRMALFDFYLNLNKVKYIRYIRYNFCNTQFLKIYPMRKWHYFSNVNFSCNFSVIHHPESWNWLICRPGTVTNELFWEFLKKYPTRKYLFRSKTNWGRSAVAMQYLSIQYDPYRDNFWQQ